MKNSIVSYETRGKYGLPSWRGNCSGRLIKDLLLQFRPSVFVDPMMGSDTAGDVVREMQLNGYKLEYHGFDLHAGFNAITDSISAAIGGKRADYIFNHPPYHSIFPYSGAVWGKKPHPGDLSRCDDYEDFLSKMRLVMQNMYDALAPEGRYSILIGDLRKNGEYTSIQSDFLQLAPGKLDSIVIKAQHNCVSDRKEYTNNRSIPIGHEYLLTWRNDRLTIGFLDSSLKASSKLASLARANWKSLISYAFQQLGGKASLPDLYEVIASTAPEKLESRPNWQARVRAELQRNFVSVERGVWAMS